MLALFSCNSNHCYIQIIHSLSSILWQLVFPGSKEKTLKVENLQSKMKNRKKYKPRRWLKYNFLKCLLNNIFCIYLLLLSYSFGLQRGINISKKIRYPQPERISYLAAFYCQLAWYKSINVNLLFRNFLSYTS